MDQNQNENIETATSYYNAKRRKSFFLSRLFVFASMFILIVALSVNIAVLYSDQRTSTTTRASEGNNQTNLPSLPAGCEYQSQKDGVVVSCPTKTPNTSPTLAADPDFPISVELPELPEPCDYEASGEGLAVKCNSPSVVIPTVPVRTVTSCVVGTEKDTLICSEASGEKVIVPLPALPEGCEYQVVSRNYFVSCKASTNTVQN